MTNLTHAFTTYTLLQPSDSNSFRHVYFTCFLLLYVMILLVNIWLSVVIVLERTLHQPMYIFLCNLCINDVYGAAGFYPKLLHDLILDSYVIPPHMCALQTFVIYSSVMCDCTTIAAMAYDRHVAICQPLDYHTKLNRFTCGLLLCLCWIQPIIYMVICLVLSNTLRVCKNEIHKFYCDNWSMVKLSCEPTVINSVYGLCVIAFYLCMSMLIVLSYIKLALACKGSLENKKKFWQTCVPHLIITINYIVSLFCDNMYSRYGSTNVPENLLNFMALEIVIVPPLFNPVVYGLKLKEVREKILKSFGKRRKISCK